MDAREALLRDLFRRLNERRFDIGDLLTDDAQFDVPYAHFPEPVIGRAAFVRMFDEVTAGLFNPFEFTLQAFYPCTDGESIVVEYASKGMVTTTGRPYANRYAGIFRIRDGRIALWREFFNPEEFARATTP